VTTAIRAPDGRPDFGSGQPVPAGHPVSGRRRALQLGLASLWLLDAMLQGQSFMFSPGFARMLTAAARGSPAAVAGPGNWAAHLIGQHPVAANSAFAVVQLLLALGIAWRPAVKFALAVSVPWSLAVWWLGEGLGGMLAPGANLVTGAPGAVFLYAVLAVVLWPSDRVSDATFPAASAVGAPLARVVWLALWAGLAWLTVRSVSRSPRLLPAAISAQAAGQPRWLASTDRTVASLIADHQVPIAVTLAMLLAIIALGVFLPSAGTRCALMLAVLVALVTWVAGQNLGGVFTGTGTDPSSGPLLVLLAAAYWPASSGTVPGQAGEAAIRRARRRLAGAWPARRPAGSARWSEGEVR
jgi:hypothetical protein